jgi:ABC-2 type transport system permease protein
MKVLLDSFYVTIRHLRKLGRQRSYLALTFLHPAIGLFLYAQVFSKIVGLSGFGYASYITFICPGMVVMTAMFSGGWSGMIFIEDINSGVMDRLLVTPIGRLAIMLGRIVQVGIVTAIQTVMLTSLALLLGAHFRAGLTGTVVLAGCTSLLAGSAAALSNGLALLSLRHERFVTAINFVLLPPPFLSTVFMSREVLPKWIRETMRFNPLNWAVEAGRYALDGKALSLSVSMYECGLVVFLAFSIWWGSRAFRTYQRAL